MQDQSADAPEITPTPAELVARWADARTRLEQTIAHLTPDQLAGPSSAEDWAVKDHLIHLAMWAQGIGALLRQQPRWPAMGLDPAWIKEHGHVTDAMNAVIYDQHKDQALSEVQAIFAAVHDDVSAFIAQLSTADIERPYGFFEAREDLGEAINDPIWYWIMGNTSDHYGEHHEWISELIERRGWQASL